jgi:hypothetical protein
MIIFNGTKKVGVQSYLIFKNETGASVEIPVEEQMQSMFLHYFHRLSSGIKDVEVRQEEGSRES